MHRTRRSGSVLFILTPLAFALQTGSVFAQDPSFTLEEIIVTAQRRAENVLEVPISITVETAASLQKKGVTTLEGLSLQTPSLVTQDGGRISSVAIRGLGSAGLDTVESSVGIYIDEIYYGRSRLSRNPLFDMDRIEVLRGPQGTLYGRNTIAGAIAMHTARPTEEFSARLLAEAGNLDSHKLEGSISGPLADNFAMRLAVLNSKRGTYLKNEIGPDGAGQDTEGYRVSASWNPAEDLSLFAKYETMVHEQVGVFDQLVGDPFGVWAHYPGIDLRRDHHQQVNGIGPQALKHPGGYFTSEAAAVHLNWDLPGGYSLKSVSGWTTYDARSRDWITASPDSSLTINGMTERVEYWSQELRIMSPEDRPLRFLGGAFIDYYDVKTLPQAGSGATLNLGNSILPAVVQGLATSPALAFLGPLQPSVAAGFANGTREYFRLTTPSGDPVSGVSNLDQLIKTWSVFFEGQYDFNPSWRLTLGVRYAKESNDTRMGKGTFYHNGLGLPWGAFPTPAQIAASAVAADPTLAAVSAYLPSIYAGVTTREIAPGLPFSMLPLVIAAPGGTPLAKDSLDEDHWIPSLKLQYFPRDDAMFYLTVATGFKAGGFNSSNINVYTRAGDTFGGEEALAIEIGGKLTLLEGRAQLNFAVFHTNFDDMQASTISPQGAATVVNAAKAVSQGFEIDGTWRITEALTAGAAWAWLDAHYEDSKELSCGAYMKSLRQMQGEDFTTRPCTFRLDKLPNGKDDLQRAPRNTITAWAEYRTALSDAWELQLFATVNRRDKVTTMLDASLWTQPITILNARIALNQTRDDWTVALFGNNLLDDDGLLLLQENSGGAVKGIITTPRMWGLQLVKNW